ncbi:heat shock 70 kDa protein 12B-like [Saccostrea cucullata]|uniref:heat shock 70 kDa protein 12B-like n=1 Tax=Saccostrea cuccullata TaxID=36930 RepID=UPI002ED5CEF4
MPALKIFSESIKFFKEHFEHLLEKITLRVKENERNMSGDVSESVNDNDERKVDPKNNAACSWSADILWVLTVPAIWSDEAKQFMREAAIQAGIQDDHLVLALEPESAALLCKQLKLTENSNATNIEEFEPGSKFMVVDCMEQ